MSRKKKTIIFLSVVVVLFFISVGFGLMRGDSDMEQAMAEVRSIVEQTRRDIQKEMDKPFILRIFGSLFGMENNSFQALKEDLPPIIKEAMPNMIGKVSHTGSSGEVACDGMQLSDALLLIKKKNVKLTGLNWAFDDALEEKIYIKRSGMVLQSEQDDAGIRITLQMPHSYNTTNGLKGAVGGVEVARQELNDRVYTNRTAGLVLESWYPYEDAGKRDLAISSSMKTNVVTYADVGEL